DFNGDGWSDAVTANSGGGDASVLINDHAWIPLGAPSVSINDVTVTEGNTGSATATVTLTLSAAYGQPITVHYVTAAGSAAGGRGRDHPRGPDYPDIYGGGTRRPTSRTDRELRRQPQQPQQQRPRRRRAGGRHHPRQRAADLHHRRGAPGGQRERQEQYHRVRV